MRRNNTYISYASGDDLCSQSVDGRALTFAAQIFQFFVIFSVSQKCRLWWLLRTFDMVRRRLIRSQLPCAATACTSFRASSHFSAFAVSLGKCILSDRLFAPIRSGIDQEAMNLDFRQRNETNVQILVFPPKSRRRGKRNPT